MKQIAEKLAARGAAALTDAELLALLVGDRALADALLAS
ncbi:MAG TPA: DNA repair protein RadC, partial [Alistipes sp.]|nr:DNA repair protein RadC [Alistipes sp.]